MSPSWTVAALSGPGSPPKKFARLDAPSASFATIGSTSEPRVIAASWMLVIVTRFLYRWASSTIT